MDRIKRAGRFLCSMKCAVILLAILALACTVGSLIPQGQTTAYYMANYAESLAGAILLFRLDDVFHCWWFVGLTLFLCANLLACNVLRFPALIRRMREGFTPLKRLAEWNGVPAAVTAEKPEEVFRRLGFRKEVRGVASAAQLPQNAGVKESVVSEDTPVPDASASFAVCYAVRHRAGIWGAWLCHFGMLVVIGGFGLGQMFQVQYTVYGVPGQTKPIGDTGYELRIDDFQVKLREDATVEQYETAMTVLRPSAEIAGGDQTDAGAGEAAGTAGAAASASGVVSVNHPLSVYGMKFYQNSTGWAANVQIYKGQELLQEGVLCTGEYALVEDMEGLAVVFNAFYPDYVQGADGMPMTASPALRNPGYLYTLYYHDQILGMNVLTEGQIITVEDYGILFEEPRQYTLIQIKRDPFTPVAAAGGVLVMLSLILAFYLQPEEVWAVQREDGTWALAGKSRKTGAYFLEELAKYGGKAEENGEGQPGGE